MPVTLLGIYPKGISFCIFNYFRTNDSFYIHEKRQILNNSTH